MRFSSETHCPDCFSSPAPWPVCKRCGFDRSRYQDDAVYLPEFSLLAQGRYAAGRVLGRPGGFGIVYCGWHQGLHRRLAIKEFFPRQLASRSRDSGQISTGQGAAAMFESWKSHFLREARLLARFQDSPHVVTAFDVFEDKGTAYMAMERLEGQNLYEYLGGFGRNNLGQQVFVRRLDKTQAEVLLQALLNALDALHGYLQEPIYHRDLTPNNIFLPHADPAQAKLLDFGLARSGKEDIRHDSTVGVGTPLFVAPEQLQREARIGPYTDFYTLGVVFYAALSGQLPPQARTRLDLPELPLTPLAERAPEVDPTWCALIDACLEMDPQRRPQSVAEIRERLAAPMPPTEQLDSASEETILEPLSEAAAQSLEQAPPSTVSDREKSHVEALPQAMKPANSRSPGRWSVMSPILATLVLALVVGSGLYWYLPVRDRLSSLETKEPLRQELGAQFDALTSPAGSKALNRASEQLHADIKQHLDAFASTHAAEALTSASEALRKLEDLDPEGTAVAQTREKIALGYAALVETALKNDELGAAQRWLDQGEKMQPGVEKLTALRDKLKTVAGELSITTEPAGAEIYVDNRYLGPSPQTVEKLPPDQLVMIEAKLEGYEDYREQVQVSAGRRSELQLVLDPVPPESAPESEPTKTYLTVKTTPPDTRVRIMNIVPRYEDSIELEPGEYDLEISAPGYETYRNLHTLATGEQTLKIELEKSSAVPVPEMVFIKGGCYQMGSPPSEEGRNDDERHHRVCVEDFYIGRYEVTFDEYDHFARATGRELPNDNGWGRGQRPVMNVSWHDAMAYLDWLSQQGDARYRLPTETEWEYAARAGTQTAYWWGDDIGRNHANCDGCGSRWDNEQTAPVGSFPANPWGLYDTAGNVWEWTCSRYVANYGGHEKRCANKGYRVFRGGSWSYPPHTVRPADRLWHVPAYRSHGAVGFRPAASL